MAKTSDRSPAPLLRLQRGQGLLEFALILPVLLLMLWGLIEFARIFQAYLTAQHAAREGVRYAVTGQYILLNDPDGIPGNFDPGETWASRPDSIIAATHIAGLGLNQVTPFTDTAALDPQPDTPYYFDVVLDPPDGGDPYGIGSQDTLTVTVHYNVPLLTPLIKDLLGDVVHVTGQAVMQNEAFDSTPGAYVYSLLSTITPSPTPTDTDGDGMPDDWENGYGLDPNDPSDALQDLDGDGYTNLEEYQGGWDPTDPNDPGPPTATPTMTPTPIVDGGAATSTPTATGTAAPTPTDTATPTPTPIPLSLNAPLVEGDTLITGMGEPGQTVILRDFSQSGAPIIGTGVIQLDGTFSISVSPLIAGHIIVGAAGTSTDFAIVSGTATATPTATHTPTATPTLAPNCVNSTYTQSNIPGSSSIGVFTLSSFTGVGDRDELKIKVQPASGDTWEYKIKFKDFGGTVKIDKIEIKYGGTKEYDSGGGLALDIPSTLDLLDLNSVTGDTTNYDYDGSAVNVSDSNTLTVEFPSGKEIGSVCLTIASAPSATPTPTPTPTATPTAGPNCASSTYTQNDIPGSNSIGVFTLDSFTGVGDGDELKVRVEPSSGDTWEYKIKFKDFSGTVKIDKIEIQYPTGGSKEYDSGGGLALDIPSTLDLLDLNSVTGDTTNYDYDGSAVNVSDSNTLTVEFPSGKEIGSVCLTISSNAPTDPDLHVVAMSVAPSTTISATHPITVEVVVENQGTSVNSLSWVNFYADPSPAPPSVGQLGYAWSGIDSLAAGGQITVTFTYPGFDTSGDHPLYAQVDTWNQITEDDETNNVHGPITVTVSSGGSAPTPTPTPPANAGSVSGSTWLLYGGDLVPLGYVLVECRSGATVVATTVSDASGNYDFGMVIPPGIYDIYGEATLNGTIYSDLLTGVEVISNTTTVYVTLILH